MPLFQHALTAPRNHLRAGLSLGYKKTIENISKIWDKYQTLPTCFTEKDNQ